MNKGMPGIQLSWGVAKDVYLTCYMLKKYPINGITNSIFKFIRKVFTTMEPLVSIIEGRELTERWGISAAGLTFLMENHNLASVMRETWRPEWTEIDTNYLCRSFKKASVLLEESFLLADVHEFEKRHPEIRSGELNVLSGQDLRARYTQPAKKQKL